MALHIVASRPDPALMGLPWSTPLEEWSVSGLAARLGRFGKPTSPPAPALSQLSYAYHFDASLYARYLRAYAEGRGVRRVEGEIVQVDRTGNGLIGAVHLAGGRAIRGVLGHRRGR